MRLKEKTIDRETYRFFDVKGSHPQIIVRHVETFEEPDSVSENKNRKKKKLEKK